MPSITWDSQETPPKRPWISAAALATKSGGTGGPSLNVNGKRISKRQYTLIRGRSLNRKWNPFPCHRHQGLLWNGNLAGGPRMPRESANQKPQGALLSRFVMETDNDHSANV